MPQCIPRCLSVCPPHPPWPLPKACLGIIQLCQGPPRSFVVCSHVASLSPPSQTVWGPSGCLRSSPPRLPQYLTGSLRLTMTAWISPRLSQCPLMLFHIPTAGSMCGHNYFSVPRVALVCTLLLYCYHVPLATTEHPLPQLPRSSTAFCVAWVGWRKRSLQNKIFRLVALEAGNVQPLIDWISSSSTKAYLLNVTQSCFGGKQVCHTKAPDLICVLFYSVMPLLL